jgi:hypothetical protein
MKRVLMAATLFAGLCSGSVVQAEEIGPHKMPVAEWGDEQYHLEVIPDAKTGTVTVYVYGNHADLDKAKKKPIDAKSLVVAFKNPSVVVKLTPAPEKGEPKGWASKFVGKSDALGKLGKLEGTISGKIGTKPYTGDFKQK